MNIIESYFELQREYENKFGLNTVVLFHLGKFYEIYEYHENEKRQKIGEDKFENTVMKYKLVGKDTKKVGHAISISIILNMQLASKNKNIPHSIDNPYFVGFPTKSYINHKDIILMNGYTIIRIDQNENNPKDRRVLEIVSPGTDIISPILAQTYGGNVIISLYLENQIKGAHELSEISILCGVSAFNVATGESNISEIYAKDNDDSYIIHELYRYIKGQQPIEIIINVMNFPEGLIDEYKSMLISQLELDKCPKRLINFNTLNQVYKLISYQETLLNKCFESMSNYQDSTTNIIVNLDLELYTYGRISYGVLLQYCYDHNENLIKKIKKPCSYWLDNQYYLILTHNAIVQLDVFPKIIKKTKCIDSLYAVVDNCYTKMGSRLIKKRLSNPITNHTELNKFYDISKQLQNYEVRIQEEIINKLKKLVDVEYIQRCIRISNVTPKQLSNLIKSYQYIKELLKVCIDNKYMGDMLTEEEIYKFEEVYTKLVKEINVEILGKIRTKNVNINFLMDGYHEEVHELVSNIKKYEGWLECIKINLNEVIGNKTAVKIIKKNGTTILETTVTRGVKLKNNGNKVNQEICGEIKLSNCKAKTIITSELIDKCITTIDLLNDELNVYLKEMFNKYVSILNQESFLDGIVNFIQMIDFCMNNVKLGRKYGYHVPTIDGTSQESSYLEAVDLRHPIIERIIMTEYICNDVSLGKQENGMLIYGINSAGKSSLSKAVGLVILLAQGGFYVPAKLKYKPFNKIITRLSGHDDIFKSESSFIVEMKELKTILKNSDENTLVIGDELCRGTEIYSGTCITIATIQTLIERNCKFIFATHMHNLIEMKSIRDLSKKGKIGIKHLHSYYNDTLHKLVYNRKITEGPGSKVYGLDVCKSLEMDDKFIELALETYKILKGNPEYLVNPKQSHFNTTIFVHQCVICKSSQDLHNHHIIEQHKANENGMINHYHKNSNFNLITLCENCHKLLHKYNQTINQYQTLSGVVMEITKLPSE